MDDITEQKSSLWQWKRTLALVCFLIGCTSLFLGTGVYLFGSSSFFHSDEQQRQAEILAKIHYHVKSASISHNVKVAKQELIEAVSEIEGYIKAQPLVEISNNNFENWYKGMLEIKHQLVLTEQVESSNASALQKLQAENIALESVKNFAEIKLKNVFGFNLGVEYNLPSSIPLKLNPLETAITAFYWVFFLIVIASVVIVVILIYDDLELYL